MSDTFDDVYMGTALLHAKRSKAARYDRYFMDIAHRSAEMSYAKRLRVGAVITRDNRIISTGFNGSPPGHDNCCEIETENGVLVSKKSTIHAEENAILFAARTGISTENATIYCTHSPCFFCARLIVSAGIRSVIYSEKYRDDEGVRFLIDSSVSIVELNTKSTTPKETDDCETSTSHNPETYGWFKRS